MDAEQKKVFINDFCNAMRDAALAKVPDMPENWDGHELRRYLADKIRWEVTSTMREGRSRRVKEYGNACINRNL